ncbi:primosomal protein N' [Pelagibacteraceae bacterium]|nr:primosomal protein N' [Pelagibacteraceae bacterium]
MKVQVLLPKIFDFTFTYNHDSKIKYKIGDIVEIPFGLKNEIGVIWSGDSATDKKIKIKNIKKKVGNYFLDKKLIKFIEWFSMYNMASKGLVLKMCIGGSENYFKKEEKNTLSNNIRKKKYQLNDQQINALNYLKSDNSSFNVSVLQGVTGSGKTLVYFEKIKKVIIENKQVLVLLPEIFLTNQFKERFEDFFGFEPAVWHSKITPKNKRMIWQGLINNKIKLLIGARSSLLLPFKKLGLIVVDEEHDSSYKQDEGTIYNARDMAIARASVENIPIDLVSSIPSVETYNNIKNKKYRHTKISKRFNDYPLPDTKIINLNLDKIKHKYIANETINLVKDFLKKEEQILFFINRRGYAPYIICKVCGFKHICPDCSIYLTYHNLKKKAVCHHCGYKKDIQRKCKDNKLCDFLMYGPGVEKIFDEIKNIFPKNKIKIFSSDFMQNKKQTDDLFQKINNSEIDILVGTQMISKGFNFPKLNCIVVVDADFSGRGYDLRTTEKNIQLFHQLSGRAGRFSNKSLVVYQTITPEDETLNNLIKNNPEKFLDNELILRKKNRLPPFFRLIAIIISSTQKELSYRGAQEVKNKLKFFDELEVLGPVESPISKVKKRFRSRLLLRFNNNELYQKKIAKLLKNLKISSKIKLTVDVDPVNFT